MSNHKRNTSIASIATSAVLNTASSISDYVYQSSSILPLTASDRSDEPPLSAADDEGSRKHALIAEVIEGVQAQMKRGAPLHLNAATLVWEPPPSIMQ